MTTSPQLSATRSPRRSSLATWWRTSGPATSPGPAQLVHSLCRAASAAAEVGEDLACGVGSGGAGDASPGVRAGAAQVQSGDREAVAGRAQQDRKSTRLNSSHV